MRSPYKTIRILKVDKIVIAFVGPIAVGKGTAIKLLEKKGFVSSSTSDRIREEIKKRGEEVDRYSLTKVSNELRETYGDSVLAKRTADVIENIKNKYIVIDSIRNPEEINYLREKYGIKIIALLANQKRRYEQFSNRTLNSQPMTFEAFKDLDDKELYGTLGEHTQRVSECIKMADATIENVGSIEELEEKLTEVLKNLGINP